MDIYVVDDRLAGLWWSNAERRPGRAFQVTRQWSMNRIAHRILHYVGRHAIGVLRLCCHGDFTGQGGIRLGQGLNPENAREFHFLRGRFTRGRGGRIEVHSCAILSGTPIQVRSEEIIPGILDRASATPGTLDPDGPGARAMAALAQATGEHVVACVDAQQPDRAFLLEGQVAGFEPTGRLVFTHTYPRSHL